VGRVLPSAKFTAGWISMAQVGNERPSPHREYRDV
jgi:hypothetical protein